MLSVKVDVQIPEAPLARMFAIMAEQGEIALENTIEETVGNAILWGEEPPDETKREIWEVANMVLERQGYPRRPIYPRGHLVVEYLSRIGAVKEKDSLTIGVADANIDEATGHEGGQTFYVDLAGTGFNPPQPFNNIDAIAERAQVHVIDHGYWYPNEVGFPDVGMLVDEASAKASQEEKQGIVSEECVTIGGVMPGYYLVRALLSALSTLRKLFGGK